MFEFKAQYIIFLNLHAYCHRELSSLCVLLILKYVSIDKQTYLDFWMLALFKQPLPKNPPTL